MTRKLIAIFSALLIAASLCACTGETGEGETTATPNIDISGNEDTSGDGETGNQIEGPVVSGKNPGDYSYSEKNDKIYVLGSALNLRTADYEAYKSVPEGTELQRTGISTDADGKWSRVSYEGTTLYVSNKYITLLPELDAGFTAVEKTLTAAKSLKCHIAPEDDMSWQSDVKIVKWYETGDTIKVVMENTEKGWYKVEFEVEVKEGEVVKKYGYMYSTPGNFQTEAAE